MNPNTTCTSVFKTGATSTTTEDYTRKWLELIHQIERNKAIVAGAK